MNVQKEEKVHIAQMLAPRLNGGTMMKGSIYRHKIMIADPSHESEQDAQVEKLTNLQSCHPRW